jgi:hypothetical protein
MANYGELRVVSDLDDVHADTATRVIEFTNRLYRPAASPLTLEDYNDHFAEMWGVDTDETMRRWGIFCKEWMANVTPMEGAGQTQRDMPRNAHMEILTARDAESSGDATRLWVSRHLARVSGVNFANVGWGKNADAHKRTKREELILMKPHMFIEDQPRHLTSLVDLPIRDLVVFTRPWNRGLSHPRIMRVSSQAVLSELIQERAAEKLVEAERAA